MPIKSKYHSSSIGFLAIISKSKYSTRDSLTYVGIKYLKKVA